MLGNCIHRQSEGKEGKGREVGGGSKEGKGGSVCELLTTFCPFTCKTSSPTNTRPHLSAGLCTSVDTKHTHRERERESKRKSSSESAHVPAHTTSSLETAVMLEKYVRVRRHTPHQFPASLDTHLPHKYFMHSHILTSTLHSP